MAAARFTIHGQVLAPIRSPYASLVWPVVVLRRLLRYLHQLIVQACWSELIENKPADPVTSSGLFLIFCILSLAAYHNRAISGLSLSACYLLWVIDYQLAKRQFMAQHSVDTSLECREDWAIWQLVDGSNLAANHLKFQVSEITQISLIRVQVRGGAFQEVLGIAWQVYLTLCNRSELLLHETPDTKAAFAKAAELSRHFAVPLTVVGSEGQSSLAAQPLQLQGLTQRTQSCTTIGCQKSAQRWHIFCKWQLSSTWCWLGKSLSRFSFLLFTVIMANLMILAGGLLHQSAISLVAQVPVSFEPTFWVLRWQMLIELAAVGGIMLIRGAQLSREEHLYITPASLTFCLGSLKIAQMPTGSIHELLFLKQPFPTLLILGEQAIEIHELQYETEFRVMLLHLQAAREALQI